jgi:raffinose/stachyose/melibiose transport system permease protein
MTAVTAIAESTGTTPALYHNRRRVQPWRIVATIVVGLYVLISIMPVVSIVLGAFKTTSQISTDPLGLPSPVEWSNFVKGWNGVAVGNAMSTYFFNSILFTVASVAVSIITGTLGAYVIARRSGRVAALAERYFVILYTLPFLAYIIPLFSLAGSLGMRSQPFSVGIIFAATWMPLTLILMVAFFSGIPLDVIEAAKIDGASEWRIFRSIVLPLSKGAILSNVLLAFIYSWNNLSHTLPLLVVPNTRTVAPGLLLFTQQYSVDVGAQLAGMLISVLPLVAAYLLLHKHIMESFRVGSFR